jgi:hypothetical protein
MLILIGMGADVGGESRPVLRDAALRFVRGRIQRPDTPVILPRRPDQSAELLPVSCVICPARQFLWVFGGLQTRVGERITFRE